MDTNRVSKLRMIAYLRIEFSKSPSHKTEDLSATAQVMKDLRNLYGFQPTNFVFKALND